jgi:hypothetical protein
LRELHRAIIYTTRMSKQVTKSHVRDTVHMYLVNWGAMLTRSHLFSPDQKIQEGPFDYPVRGILSGY